MLLIVYSSIVTVLFVLSMFLAFGFYQFLSVALALLTTLCETYPEAYRDLEVFAAGVPKCFADASRKEKLQAKRCVFVSRRALAACRTKIHHRTHRKFSDAELN